MRVALFARYSSRLQDELSMDAQVAEMEAYCAARGWIVTHRFLLPETRSVDVSQAEEFQAMVQGARRKAFDLVLLHKLDRFGRDRETSVVYKAMLRRAGVEVRSVVENLGDSIMDRTMEGILEVMSEWYSKNLGQEIKKGQRQLTRSGRWRGGTLPWGLTVETHQEGDRMIRVLAEDPLSGPVMRVVFRKVAAGDRSGDVIAWVESVTGTRWSRPSFYERIRNPIYKGQILFGKTSMPAGSPRRKNDPEDITEGSWAGLVDPDTWQRANDAISARRGEHTQGRKPKYLYLLTEGVCQCAACGRNLVGNTLNGQPRYVCAGRRDRACTLKSIRAEVVEEALLEAVALELEHLDLEAVVSRYAAALEPERDAARRREAALRQKVTEARKRQANLLNAIELAGGAPELLERLGEVRTELDLLGEQIATCQIEADRVIDTNVAIVREYLGQISGLLREAGPARLKALYQQLFQVEFDLEKRRGQFRMKLAPVVGDPVPFRGHRKMSGRSARI